MDKVAIVMLWGCTFLIGYFVLDALTTTDLERRQRDEKDLRILGEGVRAIEGM